MVPRRTNRQIYWRIPSKCCSETALHSMIQTKAKSELFLRTTLIVMNLCVITSTTHLSSWKKRLGKIIRDANLERQHHRRIRVPSLFGDKLGIFVNQAQSKVTDTMYILHVSCEGQQGRWHIFFRSALIANVSERRHHQRHVNKFSLD